MRTTSLLSVAALLSSAWAEIRFNVVGIPDSEQGSFGVKIGTSVTKLASTPDTFPLWSGIVPDATATVEYKYVKLNDAGTVIEEEAFVRRLTDAKAIANKTSLNEFFQRETTLWTLPNVPQVYEGILPSPSSALEAENQIATVHVTVDPVQLDTMLKNPTNGMVALVDFRYINAHKFHAQTQIKMKISGKSSTEFNKQAFKFDFDDKLNQTFFHRLHIKLRSQTQDPTMMREKVYIDVLNSIGVPTQQGVWVRLYMNKKSMGLYLMVDDISKSFLKQTIHQDDDTVARGSLIQMNAPVIEQQADLVYKGPSSANYPPEVYKMVNLGNNPPTDPLHQLILFMKDLSDFDPQTNPNPLAFWEERIDLEGFLRNMAMEYLAGSWDAYWYSGSNYFMYFNPKLGGGSNNPSAGTPGRWQWISTDFDGTFGNGDPTDTLTTYEAWVPSFASHDRPMVTKVILKCNPIRQRFEQILRDIVGWCFKPEGLFPRIDVYEKMLSAEIEWDLKISRAGYPGKSNNWTPQDFHNSIMGPVNKMAIGIKPWIVGRTKDLQAQLNFQIQAGAPDRVPRPVRRKKNGDDDDDGSKADADSKGSRMVSTVGARMAIQQQQASIRPPSTNTTVSPGVNGGGTGGGGGGDNSNSPSTSTPPTTANTNASIGGAAGAGSTTYDSPEQALLASFKAAAQSVTQLYKDSLKFSRTEHAKGYQAALQDLLTFISTHPAVQEKKHQGQTEDEIRQNTSLSVDDIVGFIREAEARNGSHLNAEAATSQQQQQLHAQQQLQQQQQQQQHEHMLQQQRQQEQALQQHMLQSQIQHHQQQQQQHHHQQQQQEHHHHQQQQQPLAGHLHGTPGGIMLPQATAFPAAAPVAMAEFPSESFTFTAPIFHPALDQHVLQGPFPGNHGPEGGIGIQTSADSLKRRYALQDYNMACAAATTAAGRMTAAANAARFNSSPMHLDSLAWNVDPPPFKRGRRREGE
ncbi:hypothetical protein BGW41_006629 [Actinomortierella wolfii]|nr:hypothetical protein BGW41_006629 [Actinomortierella wolfii]